MMVSIFRRLLQAWLFAMGVAALSACGSGGGESLPVLPPVPAAPNITNPPMAVAVNIGQTANFSVLASGTGLVYQWKRGGADIAGATTASYALSNPTLADSGALFSVVVANLGGSETSSAAALTVADPPMVVTQPANVSVTEGTTAQFQVVATGTALTYQWRKNGAAIAGATAATYTTPATVLADNATTYSVVVSNIRGSLNSVEATLTVQPGPPTIVRGPESVSVVAGNAVTFSVFASGTTPFTYQWRRAGVAIAGATQSTYTFTPTLADHNTAFSVMVSNSLGSTASDVAQLSVFALPQAITILMHPQNVTVRDRERPTFNVEIAGTGPFTVVWLRNGVEQSTTRLSNVNSTRYALQFQAFLATDNGALYSMTISNAFGSVTTNQGLLTVLP